ncbi:hypothetical protein GFL02_21895 [Pseudomonas stutzeri]|nr:hypothetical protein [Stutzerimonas frequens]MBK3874757.1 hypothetical protein [Stutzerimonas frequens]MBK3908681.1 hypothetical protein [Stutzerimonas frequens]MBK3932231.1 hypothetical protein [Stutzerimonas frequens]
MNGGALFNAEFGIRHRGSTVPERSGVALSCCRRQRFRVLCPKLRTNHCRSSGAVFRVLAGVAL